MAGFLATSTAILINGLVLLGMAFILSRGFQWLRTWPERHRAIILSIAFSTMAVGSMMLSFPMGPGLIGDLRNVVLAVAAIVGGPVPALVAAAAATAYRIHLGGQSAVAVLGIAVGAGLSIGFAQTKLPKTPRNLALLGVMMAVANASLPIAALLFTTVSLEQAVRIGTMFFAFTVVVYPIGIVVIGGLLKGEQRRAEEEMELQKVNKLLSLQAARTQGVFESSSVAMAWTDLKSSQLILVNPQYAKFTGYTEAELIGMRIDQLAVPGDLEKEVEFLRPFRVGEITSVTTERRYLRKDGAIVWGLRALTAVREDGEPRYGFAIVQDITERKRAREEIAYLASHDSLTGLVNRLVFQTELSDAIAHRRSDERLVVLCLDLDGFKEINDTLGHPAGDAILIEVGKRVQGCVGKGDIVARLGGDEFAVLRIGTPTDAEIRALAESMIDLVRQPYKTGNDLVVVQVSIGIALGVSDEVDAEHLVKKADISLYAAKAKGGNAYRFFEPEMEQRLIDRQALKVDLTAALSNNELEIEYQPIVDLRTGSVASLEALLRWRHPRRGMIPPSEFILLAEETGLITPIGDWVLNRACREATNWPVHVGLAVNVSPVQLRDQLLALRVATILSQSGLSPHRLELEITETALLHGSEDNLRCLRDLRRLGVKIALDDFGTGFSSLGYLRRFPFDRIKIDRSFVVEVTESQEARAVVRSIIGLGHSLNMRITAEGIETSEQLDRIRAKECDEAQGFLFSKSVAAYEVPALIARLAAWPRSRVGAAD